MAQNEENSFDAKSLQQMVERAGKQPKEPVQEQTEEEAIAAFMLDLRTHAMVAADNKEHTCEVCYSNTHAGAINRELSRKGLTSEWCKKYGATYCIVGWEK